MNIFLDDIRNPENLLTTEQMENLKVFRCPREALIFFKEHHHEIEVIHLDHYLDNDRFTGGDVLERIYREKVLRGNKWNKLQTIYLHSSDETIINRLIKKFGTELEQSGVILINNHCKFNHS